MFVFFSPFLGLVTLLFFVMVGPTPQKSTLFYHYFMAEATVWDALYLHASHDFCRRKFVVLIRIKSCDPFFTPTCTFSMLFGLIRVSFCSFEGAQSFLNLNFFKVKVSMACCHIFSFVYDNLLALRSFFTAYLIFACFCLPSPSSCTCYIITLWLRLRFGIHSTYMLLMTSAEGILFCNSE